MKKLIILVAFLSFLAIKGDAKEGGDSRDHWVYCKNSKTNITTFNGPTSGNVYAFNIIRKDGTPIYVLFFKDSQGGKVIIDISKNDCGIY